jgi:predicted site-specific integrase-resolvase
MNLAVWAKRSGVVRVTADRWFRFGTLVIPARRVGRLIAVDELASDAGPQVRTAVHGRVPLADQKQIWNDEVDRGFHRDMRALYSKRTGNRAKRALAAAAATEELGAA